jgi:hypothetical protein
MGGNKYLIYGIVFLVLIAVAAAYLAYTYLGVGKTEKFVASSSSAPADPASAAAASAASAAADPATSSAASSGSYDSRLFVLQTFETGLHRKPTEAELAKYSALGSNDAIMRAIVADYPAVDDGDVSDDASDASDGECDDPLPPPPGPIIPTVTPSAVAPPKGPKPYDGVPGRRTTSPPDIGAKKTKGVVTLEGGDCGRVCLDRSDVVLRLQSIADEVEQFRRLVAMM